MAHPMELVIRMTQSALTRRGLHGGDKVIMLTPFLGWARKNLWCVQAPQYWCCFWRPARRSRPWFAARMIRAERIVEEETQWAVPKPALKGRRRGNTAYAKAKVEERDRLPGKRT
jgi:hypothetical protein